MKKKYFIIGVIAGIVIVIIFLVALSFLNDAGQTVHLPSQKNQTKDLAQEFADTLSTDGEEAVYALMAPQEYSLDYPYNKSYGMPIMLLAEHLVPPQDHVEITLMESRQITPAMQANGLSKVEIWCAKFLPYVNGQYYDRAMNIWVVVWKSQTFILRVSDGPIPCQ